MRKRSRLLCAMLLAASLLVSAVHADEPSDADLVSETRIMNLESGTKGIGPQQKAVLAQAGRWAMFKIDVKLDRPAYKIGEPMSITFTAPRDCYVLVYYIDATGNAAVVCPSPFSTRNQLKAGVPFKLVDNAGKPLMQTGPTGFEQLQVLASDKQFDLARLSGLDAAAATAIAAPKARPSGKPSPSPQPQHPPSTRPAYTRPAYVPPTHYTPPVKTTAPPKTTPQKSTPSKPAPTKVATRPTSSWVNSLVGKPLRVASREDFSKSVEIQMRDHIVETSNLVSERYDKGIGPSTVVDDKFKCFAITSVKYEVLP